MKKTHWIIAATLLVFSGQADLSAQELYPQDNAASIAGEANTVIGWHGNTLETSVSSESYSGDYSIKLESPGNGWYTAEYDFATEAGEQYVISIYVKSVSPEGPGFFLWEGFSDFVPVDIVGTGWINYTATLTASGTTAKIRIYTGEPSILGSTVYVDHISITKVGTPDTQDPTPPTLSSMGKTDTTVDLSWSGATDNTAVTGYKVFKDAVLETTLGAVSNYQVTGLTASTAYQFTVTALDAANNESTASNAVSATTNAASAGGSGNWTLNGSDLNYTAGNVAIGITTIPADYKLAVDGKVITEEVKVQLQSQWPDYVFNDDYSLPTLWEIQKYIEEYGHLPKIPSAVEVKTNGIELGEMNRLLLEKIEELTLYILNQEQKINAQEVRIQQLEKRAKKE